MSGRPGLNVREQAAWMRNDLPGFRTEVAGRTLMSRGKLHPTPLSNEYSIVIQYEFGHPPRVFVPGGQLHRRDERQPIPHTYADDEPCLYYPKYGEWTSDMKIASSIIRWLALWLMYYEIWSVTGEWLGGGIEHKPVEEPTQ